MRRSLFVLALAVSVSGPAEAQRLHPAGIVQSAARGASYARLTVLTPKPAAGDNESHIWLWTGIGAFTGAVVGGIWAGVEISHEDEVFFPQIAVAAGVGLGAIAGGVLGAISYMIAHSEPQP